MKKYILGLISLIFTTFLISCSKSDINRPLNNNTDSTYHLNISGQLQICNHHDMTNGDLVIVCNQGYQVLHITNGRFDTTLTSTSTFDSIFVWAIDLDALKVSDTISLQITSDTIQLGILAACNNNLNEYIKCSINQDTIVYAPMLFDTLSAGGFDTLGAPTTYFYRSSQHVSNSKFYRMQFAGMATGTYGVNWNSSIHMGRYYSFNMPSAGTIIYTSYGPVGGYIEGTLHVPFVDNTDSLDYTLNGSFRVRRDY